MKKQIRCNLTLSSYATAGLYDDGFTVRVTRQISSEAVDFIKDDIMHCSKYIERYQPEVYSTSGRWYLSVYMCYNWGEGVWPSISCKTIRKECQEMHNFVMSTILNWQAVKLNAKRTKYLE